MVDVQRPQQHTWPHLSAPSCIPPGPPFTCRSHPSQMSPSNQGSVSQRYLMGRAKQGGSADPPSRAQPVMKHRGDVIDLKVNSPQVLKGIPATLDSRECFGEQKVGPDWRPVPTISLIYVAPVSRLCSGTQQGMKVLTASVGEGGC
ncbi:unnamed protein product [Tetraodon nigroviridis]|uniref:(spotted green pufferfish) hypothetical protein n=1 Tax=Tetraodon nigroviridis TaxID=99883 RepID=Q4SMU7_TETNG|nr:unnamed protein product [Tetraodon nigroviridis]